MILAKNLFKDFLEKYWRIKILAFRFRLIVTLSFYCYIEHECRGFVFFTVFYTRIFINLKWHSTSTSSYRYKVAF